MREKFKELSDKNPNLSSAMVYSKLVRGRKMSKQDIRKYFTKFVDKADWQGTPKEELISFFWGLSNGSE
jgi:hypothetical protein